jgi:hypothetical protein
VVAPRGIPRFWAWTTKKLAFLPFSLSLSPITYFLSYRSMTTPSYHDMTTLLILNDSIHTPCFSSYISVIDPQPRMIITKTHTLHTLSSTTSPPEAHLTRPDPGPTRIPSVSVHWRCMRARCIKHTNPALYFFCSVFILLLCLALSVSPSEYCALDACLFTNPIPSPRMS